MSSHVPPAAGKRLGILPLALLPLLLAAASPGFAQVDVASRRTLQTQVGFPIGADERIVPIPYFWFNESDFGWKGTALRAVYSVTFADAELSWFIPDHTANAIGAGADAGALATLVTPYVDGRRLAREEFGGGLMSARIFFNHDFPAVRLGSQVELPFSFRLTGGLARSNFTPASRTADFVLPPRFEDRTLMGELRLGGIEPGLASDRGLELYASAEAGLRSGFSAFGPVGALYPAHDDYRRSLLSAAAKIPVGRSVFYGRLAAGLGQRVDELNAWTVGGNVVGFEPFLFTLHGYFSQEFLAEDFRLVNLAWSRTILDDHRLAFHLYADHASMKLVPPNAVSWIGRTGVGMGISFRAFGKVDWLLSYGYGLDAARDGGQGGHEIALALERSF